MTTASVGPNTNYGQCPACGVWVPRDEMLGINVSIYDAANVEERVRIRLCPVCHHHQADRLRRLQWKNDLRPAAELQADPQMAAIAGLPHDDSEAIMRVVAERRAREAD